MLTLCSKFSLTPEDLTLLGNFGGDSPNPAPGPKTMDANPGLDAAQVLEAIGVGQEPDRVERDEGQKVLGVGS